MEKSLLYVEFRNTPGRGQKMAKETEVEICPQNWDEETVDEWEGVLWKEVGILVVGIDLEWYVHQSIINSIINMVWQERIFKRRIKTTQSREYPIGRENRTLLRENSK